MAFAGLVVLAMLYSPPLAAFVNVLWAGHHATAVTEALAAGDVPEADAAAAELRDAADDIRGATEGTSGRLWEMLPGASSDREDMAHVAEAFGRVGAVINTATSAVPDDSDGFLLVGGGRVDVRVLRALVDEMGAIEKDSRSAVEALDRTEPNSLLLSGVISSTRESARSRIEPLVRVIDRLGPMLPHLPELLGAQGSRSYLLALLNPAEQRFSGGAALTFATIRLDDGKVSTGPVVAATGGGGALAEVRWPRVDGNPFHPPHRAIRITTATMAPSWSTSGEELLRGWEAAVGEKLDGVVALDVVVLQELMRYTGAIEVSGYGTLDETNLVERLIGSYDELTSLDVLTERRAGNAELVARFREQVLQPAGALGKLETVLKAGPSRHLAAYDRAPGIQRAYERLGLAGDLSDTEHDYVGVFNQAATGQKSDYWQRRAVRSTVSLRPDGSARVQLEVEIHNDSPPPMTSVDPALANYANLTNDMSLGAFLPYGAEVSRAGVDGQEVDLPLGTFEGRPYVRTRLLFEPDETKVLRLVYEVPAAATVFGEKLIYRLEVDPHSLVDPERLKVTVRWPDGYSTDFLPAGWVEAAEGVSKYVDSDLESSPRWGLIASR